MSGQFIVIEGQNLAGKTTLIKNLAAQILRAGCEVVTTREPGGTSFGEAIRPVLKDPSIRAGGFSTALCFEALRREHLDQFVRPAIAANKIVLSDRYYDSTDVFQGLLGQPPLSSNELDILKSIHQTFLIPDLTVFLLPTPAVLYARGKDMGDRFADNERESEAYAVTALESARTKPTYLLPFGLTDVDELAGKVFSHLIVSGIIRIPGSMREALRRVA